MEARKILMKSDLSTFSFGMNRDTNQKSEPAPKERKVNIPRGGMKPSPVRSLQTMMLNPKIEYAIRPAR
jgi:hypothetical protein